MQMGIAREGIIDKEDITGFEEWAALRKQRGKGWILGRESLGAKAQRQKEHAFGGEDYKNQPI